MTGINSPHGDEIHPRTSDRHHVAHVGCPGSADENAVQHPGRQAQTAAPSTIHGKYCRAAARTSSDVVIRSITQVPPNSAMPRAKTNDNRAAPYALDEDRSASQPRPVAVRPSRAPPGFLRQKQSRLAHKRSHARNWIRIWFAAKGTSPNRAPKEHERDEHRLQKHRAQEDVTVHGRHSDQAYRRSRIRARSSRASERACGMLRDTSTGPMPSPVHSAINVAKATPPTPQPKPRTNTMTSSSMFRPVHPDLEHQNSARALGRNQPSGDAEQGRLRQALTKRGSTCIRAPDVSTACEAGETEGTRNGIQRAIAKAMNRTPPPVIPINKARASKCIGLALIPGTQSLTG